MLRRLLAAVALAGLTACTSAASELAPSASAEPNELVDATFQHLAALQQLADDNDRTRAQGSIGNDETVTYLIDELEKAGFSVTRDERQADVVVEANQSLEVGGQSMNVVPMNGSPSTSVDGVAAPLVTVGAGCEAGDFASAEGAIALAERGGCSFGQKSRVAGDAGVLALVVANDPGLGLLAGDLGGEEGAVASVGVSHADGRALREAAGAGTGVKLIVQVVREQVPVVNVLAEWPGGEGDVVMVGAHLDSVIAGAGINDNGSGVALALALAENMAEDGGAEGLRLGFWGAEEMGLLGSTAYVDSLTDADVERIAAYVNLDMVASPNGVVGVYGGGEPRRALEEAFGGDPFTDIELGGYSDHAPFAGRGVAIVGIYTGANELKTAEQAVAFGGDEGKPYDACYHQECDNLDGVDTPAVRARLASIADATLAALQELTS